MKCAHKYTILYKNYTIRKYFYMLDFKGIAVERLVTFKQCNELTYLVLV